jgi:hypothetical protein
MGGFAGAAGPARSHKFFVIHDGSVPTGATEVGAVIPQKFPRFSCTHASGNILEPHHSANVPRQMPVLAEDFDTGIRIEGRYAV